MSGTPHDALFKAAFSRTERAAELLRVLLGSAARHLDLSTLAREPGSFVDSALRHRHTDLLFSARARGHRVRVYLLFEHQSSADPWLALRLLAYMLRIWEDLRARFPHQPHLPLILPVVLHHSDTGWRHDTAFDALLDPATPLALRPYAPSFRFFLEDLADHDPAALLRSAFSASIRLVLSALQQTRSTADAVALLRSWKHLVRSVQHEPDGVRAFQLVLRYLFRVRPAEEHPAIDATVDTLTRDTEEPMLNILDRAEERGIERGIERGMQRGERKFLLRMLKRRFGDVPDALRARVNAADEPTLDLWADRLFDAATLDDVFADE